MVIRKAEKDLDQQIEKEFSKETDGTGEPEQLKDAPAEKTPAKESAKA